MASNTPVAHSRTTHHQCLLPYFTAAAMVATTKTSQVAVVEANIPPAKVFRVNFQYFASASNFHLADPQKVMVQLTILKQLPCYLFRRASDILYYYFNLKALPILLPRGSIHLYSLFI